MSIAPLPPRFALSLLTLVCLAEAVTTGRAQTPAQGADLSAVSVRITSPLGRTGVIGTVRIVAQVQAASAIQLARFFVDGLVVAEVKDGPPFATEWLDENPFEAREIVVEAWDRQGTTGRDVVNLRPFEYQETAGVSSVLLEAAVHDKKGRAIRGLGRSDFLLSEDGEAQHLETLTQESVPATLALLIDSSQSMSRRMDFVQRTAESLTHFLGPRDRIIVAPFTRTLGALTGPATDRSTIAEAISAIRPLGGTAIVDSVIEMCRRLKDTEGRRALVLITDGYDEHSTHSFDEAMIAAKAAYATVYVVGIGGVAGISLRGERLLRQLATETGGRAYFPTRDEELGSVRSALLEDIENRYLIAYTPTNQIADGVWRTVALTTADPSYNVRTRTGYFAPKPPPVQPTIEFTVTDRDGKYLDVTADDLTVLEDGVSQDVEIFQDAVAPVSIFLALDASGSMRRAADQVIEAGREFVQSLRPQDSLGLILFADQPILAQDLTKNRDLVLGAIDGYVASGGTALYDALGDSMGRLKQVEGRRAIVVVTDGRDENNPGTAPGSYRTLDEMLQSARESEVTVFAVAMGPNVDRKPLEQITQLSGGQLYSPADVSDLTRQYHEVVDNLRRRYVVGYTSTNSKHDGTWRTVEIQVREPDARVLGREGYFAPER